MATGILPGSINAQDENRVARLVPSADRVVVALGSQMPFSVNAVDSSGSQVDVAIRVVAPRNSLRLSDGFVEGLSQGEFEITATLVVGAGSESAPISISVPVIVEWPPIEYLKLASRHQTLFVSTTIQHDIECLIMMMMVVVVVVMVMTMTMMTMMRTLMPMPMPMRRHVRM